MSNDYRAILTLAGPIMLANLSIPLLGIVDTAILGHLETADHLAAVAIGAQLVNFILWAFGFLKMGTTSIAAKLHGGNQQRQLAVVLGRGLLFACFLALLVLVLKPYILPLAVKLISDESKLSPAALSYSSIRLWTAPFTLCTYTFIGWFIAVKNTRAPMYILLSANLTNIILDYHFILGLAWQADGAAWASFCAEFVACAVAILIFLKRYQHTASFLRSKEILKHIFERADYLHFFAVNRHIFVRTIALMFTLTFFVAQGARLGPDILATNAILYSLLTLIAYGLDGIAHATESLTGNALGACDLKHYDDLCRRSQHIALGLAVASSMLLLVFQPLIVFVYTDIEYIQELLREYYLWLAFLPLIAVWSFQYDGVFIGSGLTKEMQYSMLIASFAIFLPVWWFTTSYANHGLWFALWTWFAGRASSQYYLYRVSYSKVVLDHSR